MQLFLWSTDLAIGVNDRRNPCKALTDVFCQFSLKICCVRF